MTNALAHHATVPRRIRAISGRLLDIVSLGVLLATFALLLPGLFGVHRYVITGGSMSGAIEPGAVVFAREVPVTDLQVGDVITYQPPADSGVQHLVTHRITEIDANSEQGLLFTTKGDANAAADPWKFRIDTAMQPKVVFAVDYLGWLLVWLAAPAHRVILVGVPATIIFLLAAREAAAALRRRPEQSLPAART